MNETALWERLDVPGHDTCRVTRDDDGWTLQGAAVFQHEFGPALLNYRVVCDSEWKCRSGEVRGSIGSRDYHLAIERTTEGSWFLNRILVPGLQNCVDLDFGFTPATNCTQLRRINLKIDEKAAFEVAWIDVPECRLHPLPQYYERRSSSTYWYESPTADYAESLRIAESGFVREYPRLWRLVDPIPSN